MERFEAVMEEEIELSLPVSSPLAFLIAPQRTFLEDDEEVELLSLTELSVKESAMIFTSSWALRFAPSNSISDEVVSEIFFPSNSARVLLSIEYELEELLELNNPFLEDELEVE